MFPCTHEYVVLSKNQETPTIATLFLAKIDGTIPEYRPGQYITVYFSDLSPTMGKQYSISSAPCENIFSLTIKAVGRFSNRLCSLKKGDTILASEPEGSFYLSPTERPLIMLGGGMGVVPFRSILLQSTTDQPTRKILLLQSTKYKNDTPFLNELPILAHSSPSVTIKQFITREQGVVSGVLNRRIQIGDMVQALPSDSADYLLCGSISFVLGLKKILLENDIEQANIYTEAR